jgi:hypothetical protein
MRYNTVKRSIQYYNSEAARLVFLATYGNRPDCTAIALRPITGKDGTTVYPVEFTEYSLD